MADAPKAVTSDCCLLDLSDVECIYIRKAFCASQQALSDFIRDFSRENEHWFKEFLSTISDQHGRRMWVENEGRQCNWDMYVQQYMMML
jgi:hypothetical protein